MSGLNFNFALMRRHSLILLAVLIWCSCATPSENVGIEKIDFTSPGLVEEEISDWISVESAISLALPDSVLIGKVFQIEFFNEKIFLVESGINSSVLIFDRKGEFKNQLLNPGAGPGEYSTIEFMVLRENSFLLYDRIQQKMVDYDQEDFSKYHEFKVQDYYLGGMALEGESGLFLVSDSEFDEKKYKGYLYSNSDLSNPRIFAQAPGLIEAFLPQSVSEFSGYNYLAQPFSEKIFKIGIDSLQFTYHLDFGSKKMPEEASTFSEAEDFYELIMGGSYYFGATNVLIKNDSYAFNFFNETIDNLNFGLIQNGNAYRFSIDSDMKELFLKPIAVREDLFHTILLPGEYNEEVVELLNLTEVDYEKPILVSYTIGK